jgi:uncharacterized protein (DUF302 family)
MKRLTLYLLLLCSTACVRVTQTTWQSEGFITQRSAYTFDETLSKLRQAIQGMGINLVAEVDHAKAAADNGLELRPTHVLIFGNPLVGTNLMQADQRTGLDLPLRLLVWQDTNGQVYLSYRQPNELKRDYTLSEQQAVLDKMGKVFEKLGAVVRE